MSVFDLPRLHFGGVAVTRLPTGPRNGLADLATNTAMTDEGPVPADQPVAAYHDYLHQRGPRFDVDGRPDPSGVFSASKGWNFGGNGHFWVEAAIVSAELPSGLDGTDPVVGRTVDMWGHYNEYLCTTVNRARVFDIDPSSNWTTTVMVGQFGFGRLGRSHDTGYMALGDVRGTHPPRWLNTRHRRDVGEHWLATYLARSAVYQFVVAADEGLTWLPEAAASPACVLLRDLLEAGEADGLVVQFAVSNMVAPVAADAPDRHEVRGTIAPWRRDESRTYPAGRLLTPRRVDSTHHGACPHIMTVAVDAHSTVCNMVTAVPVAGGRRVDLGALELRTAHTGRLVARLPSAAYLDDGFDLTSGVLTVPTESREPVDDEPLCLTGRVGHREAVVLLAEEEVNLQVDDACLVLEHPGRRRGDDHAVEVAVRSFVRGRPAPVTGIHIRQYVNPRSRPRDPAVATARCGDVDLVALRPGRLAGRGVYAGSCVVSTDQRGDGWFTVRGAAAGGARLHLTTDESDLPCPPGEPGSAATAYDNDDVLGYWSGAGCVNLRVLPDDWHLDEIGTDEVTFDLVYREIFAYYELLHSFMKDEVFSLADECKVRTYTRLVWQMSDPANIAKTYYMPPTRDMSLPKARLLLRFMRAQQAAAEVPEFVRSPRAAGERVWSRGALRAALKVASTVELAATLQYLFAAYSVPTYGAAEAFVRRGLWTPEQRRLACGDGGQTRDGGVRGTLLSVAREEMIHFLLVNNIIMAMGEAFHVPAVDFGTINSDLPVPLDFALEPLGIASVERFVALERPASEGAEVARGTGRAADDLDAIRAWGAVPSYGSISELYADIRDGVQRVPDLFMVRKGRGGGEHHLFLRESINAVHPDFQLEVDDVASALFAIDVITEQGEGNTLTSVAHPGVPPSGPSHYESYQRMSDQLMQSVRRAGAGGRAWEPAYPVARNPTVRVGAPNRTTVTDPEAVGVMNLFNRSYFLMLQLMVQHFGWIPDASLRRSKLMNAAIDVMTGMMGPLAEVLVTLPSGRRGLTAGPSFEPPDEPLYNSRPDIAMQSVALRFEHLAAAAHKCDAVPERVADMYDFYADYFRRFEVGGPPLGGPPR